MEFWNSTRLESGSRWRNRIVSTCNSFEKYDCEERWGEMWSRNGWGLLAAQAWCWELDMRRGRGIMSSVGMRGWVANKGGKDWFGWEEKHLPNAVRRGRRKGCCWGGFVGLLSTSTLKEFPSDAFACRHEDPSKWRGGKVKVLGFEAHLSKLFKARKVREPVRW